MLRIGDRIGSYEILAPLSSGGMATLFLARRLGAETFSRFVAIKVVHSHLASDEDFVRMFVEEALLSAQIDHPNVVRVEEFGEHAGTYFLVMQYVHGCSLGQLFRGVIRARRSFTPEIAVALALRVADALHAAHECTSKEGMRLEVVHRDVSPQNVLLDYRGHVKLIDFGIAKAMGRSHRTRTGSLRGKIAYMSPEQALGEAVDRRTDVYALGVILWQLLTMQKLFEADNDIALLRIVQQPRVAPPSSRAPSVSPALDAAVMAALAPALEDRTATAKEFRRRLAEALPAALSVDEAEIAALLAEVMGEEIERARQALPEEASRTLEPVAERTSIDADKHATAHTGATALLAPGIAEARSHSLDGPAHKATAAPAHGAKPTSTRWALGAGAVALIVAAGVTARVRASAVPAPSAREAPPSALAPASPAPLIAPGPSAPGAPGPSALTALTATPQPAPAPPRAAAAPRRARHRTVARQRIRMIDGVPIVDE